MKLLPSVLAFLSFAIYAYAIQRAFSRDHGVDWRMRVPQVGGAACAIVQLDALWSTSIKLTAEGGLAIVADGCGLAVFFAACGALAGNRRSKE